MDPVGADSTQQGSSRGGRVVYRPALTGEPPCHCATWPADPRPRPPRLGPGARACEELAASCIVYCSPSRERRQAVKIKPRRQNPISDSELFLRTPARWRRGPGEIDRSRHAKSGSRLAGVPVRAPQLAGDATSKCALGPSLAVRPGPRRHHQLSSRTTERRRRRARSKRNQDGGGRAHPHACRAEGQLDPSRGAFSMALPRRNGGAPVYPAAVSSGTSNQRVRKTFYESARLAGLRPGSAQHAPGKADSLMRTNGSAAFSYTGAFEKKGDASLLERGEKKSYSTQQYILWSSTSTSREPVLYS
jgi:hypothetical protein